MILAVTGHRPENFGKGDKGIYNIRHATNIKIGRAMREFILMRAGYNSETNSFASEEVIRLVSGMALGVDTIWALVALKLREQFPGKFELECAIPCENHSKKWKQEDKERHALICSKADKVTMVSTKPYAGYLMQKRNEYMVDIADEVLAVWDGSKSGTGNCVDYAIKKRVPVYQYHPFLFEEFDEANKIS